MLLSAGLPRSYKSNYKHITLLTLCDERYTLHFYDVYPNVTFVGKFLSETKKLLTNGLQLRELVAHNSLNDFDL